jgi:hypothetical protein
MKKTSFLIGVATGYLAANSRIFPDGVVSTLRKGVDKGNEFMENLEAKRESEEGPGDIMTDRPKDPIGGPDNIRYHGTSSRRDNLSDKPVES